MLKIGTKTFASLLQDYRLCLRGCDEEELPSGPMQDAFNDINVSSHHTKELARLVVLLWKARQRRHASAQQRLEVAKRRLAECVGAKQNELNGSITIIDAENKVEIFTGPLNGRHGHYAACLNAEKRWELYYARNKKKPHGKNNYFPVWNGVLVLCTAPLKNDRMKHAVASLLGHLAI